ncbi:hypothetical protein D3C71_1996660 [compost metagenome]
MTILEAFAQGPQRHFVAMCSKLGRLFLPRLGIHREEYKLISRQVVEILLLRMGQKVIGVNAVDDFTQYILPR